MWKLLIFLGFIPLSGAVDDGKICGAVIQAMQQRFNTATRFNTYQTSSFDECVSKCCDFPFCDGVSYDGFFEDHPENLIDNCVLVMCDPDCSYGKIDPTPNISVGVLYRNQSSSNSKVIAVPPVEVVVAKIEQHVEEDTTTSDLMYSCAIAGILTVILIAVIIASRFLYMRSIRKNVPEMAPLTSAKT
ncbi:unnamed protein product [Caenorhabditis bovis]|uniref:Seven cysteines N-terminal domain-containing protein n=1 Tax=Caenorhabditis bovis TaxID=2654633 RepID=A0A8S1F484_9PELO|nr:unnamed protein product [Caenorhabditis bovis]